jgi:hypothetical protein
MHPQGNIGAGNVSPQDVEPFMPIIQLLVIGALKARAAQTEHLHVIAESGAQDMFGNLGAVRQAIGYHLFTPQGCG